MKSVMENIQDELRHLALGIEEMLLESKTTPINRPNDAVIFLSPYGDRSWSELSQSAKRIQIELLEQFQTLNGLILALAAGLSKADYSDIKTSLKEIHRIIEQDGSTWHKDRKEAGKNVGENILTIQKHLNHLCESNDIVLVPDTNALLLALPLPQWNFEWASRFKIMLSPVVLSELDALKVNHKNEVVRDKARKLINQFREYFRRGDINRGVTIVKNKITLQSIAVEPDFATTLPWLNSENNDDRLLATTIEIMRKKLGCTVVLITADINMMNKAQFAKIPTDVPPSNDSEFLLS